MSDIEEVSIETPTASTGDRTQDEFTQLEVLLLSKLPEKFHIPSDKMVVPGNLSRVDLSDLVNELLSLERRIPFDFIVGGEFLRGTLASHCMDRGILSEKTLEIEYVIAMEEPNSSELTNPQSDWISGIAYGVDNFFTCSMDGFVTKYESESGKLVSSSQQSTLPLTGIVLADNGVVITCSRDGFIRFASSESLENVEVGKSDSGMTCLSLCPSDHSLVMTGTVEGSVQLWNVASISKSEKTRKRALDEVSCPRAVLFKSESSVSSIIWLSLDRALASSQEGTIRMFDPISGEVMPAISISRPISSMTCLGGKKLVTGHPDGRIIFWTLRFDGQTSCSIEALNSCRSHSRMISVLACRPESDYMVAAGSLDGTIKLFDSRASHYAIQSVSLPDKERVLTVIWISENRFLSGGSDGRVRSHRIEKIE